MNEVKYHIILVDDEEATLFYHTIMAEEAAVCNNITGCKNGNDLLSQLEFFVNENKYTKFLIFLDINMPAMDGWETVGIIEEEWKQEDKSRLFIYMVSASEHPKDAEKCIQHPLVIQMTPKPLTPEIIRISYLKMTS